MAPGNRRDWLTKHRKALILGGLTVIAYLAAINRGQAFPWATAALLCATLLAGYAWPRWLVRRLTVSRSGPSRAEEGETVSFQVAVGNAGWLPRFMVELVDRLPFVADTTETRLGLLAYLPGRRTSRFDVPVRCEKRGRYRLGPVGLATSFPLGLAEARLSRNDGVQTLTVYPDIFNIVALPLRGAPSQIHRGGYLLPEGAGAAEFSGLREYRRGDNPRHIHWPSSARLNELIVREYEPLASACLYVLLDRSVDAKLGVGKASTFEYAVRIAGSMARCACQQGIRTRLADRGATSFTLPAGSGDAHYQEILDHLAVVEADGTAPYASLLDEVGPACSRGETAVVFLAGDPGANDQTLRALATLRARQVHLFAVVFDQASFLPEVRPPRALPDHAALLGALADLGAHVVAVRRGDDLVSLFNR